MGAILNIQTQLRDTHAALAQLDMAAAGQVPPPDSLFLMGASLRKRLAQLEKEYAAETEATGVDICDYRIIPDGTRSPAAGVASAIGDFQSVFSLSFDAWRNGPKQTARVGAEMLSASSFDFAYSYAGSVGVVMTLTNEQLMFGGYEFDEVIGEIFKLILAGTPEAVLSHAKRLGPAPLRVLYQWAKDHIRYGFAADIKWKRGGTIRHQLLVQPVELRRLTEVFDRTSDETSESLTYAGELVAANTTRKTFELIVEDGATIRGTYGDAISPSQTVELPKRYKASIIRTRKVKFSTEEEETAYFLERLEPRSS